MSASSAPRAQRAYAHAREQGAEWDFSSDPPADFLAQCLDHWRVLEDRLAKVQDDKKRLIGEIRNIHGRHVAEAVKLSMQMMMLDPSKRFEKQKFNEMARRYVAVLEDVDADGGLNG